MRTQISLSERQRRALDVVSAQTGKSMAELVRAAVDEVYLSDRDEIRGLKAIRQTAGAWAERADPVPDGAAYVEALRSGRRLDG